MRRPRLRLASLAAALVLAIGPAPAPAQTVPPAPGQSMADHALAQKLRHAVDALAASERHLDGDAPGWDEVADAASQSQKQLHGLPVPAPRHDALTRAQAALAELLRAVEARDPGRARQALRDAVGAMRAVQPGLDTPPLTAPPAPDPAPRDPRAPRAEAPSTVPTLGDTGPAVRASHVAPLIGTAVVGVTGDEMGRIANFLADGEGRVHAAVVEWGGIAGLGARQSVVPIGRVQLGPASVSGLARLDMSRDELAGLARYDRDRLPELARRHGWPDGLRPAR